RDRDRDHDGDWRDRGRGDGDWTTLGRQHFAGRRDRENTFAGWAGRSVDRIALRPVDSDAVCRRVVARFESGRQADLTRGRINLNRGEVTRLDLPGGDRNLVSLSMACRAV